jgi:hypothetical protein
LECGDLSPLLIYLLQDHEFTRPILLHHLQYLNQKRRQVAALQIASSVGWPIDNKGVAA